MGRTPFAGSARPLWASQNFLTSSRLIEHLLALTTIGPQDHVLEIGPGKGHITAQVLRRCAHLTAVELDEKLCANLRHKFAAEDNLTLVHGDILDWPLPYSGDYKVVSNLPFGATTAILRRLTEAANPPLEMWLVMERGAALRFCGKPRESLRSLALKPRYEVRIVHRFHREDFHPMPSVEAVLVHLSRKTAPDVAPERFEHYQRFLSAGFNGGLAALRRRWPSADFDQAVRQARIRPGCAPGDILYIQWLCLYRCCCDKVRRP